MNARAILRATFAFVATFLITTAAQAFVAAPGLFRTYLASHGNDANPCTLSAPCRLLPAALNAVADGGEIWMLDSANYNTATVYIAKSVTILAVPGALGSVVGNGGNAISISTAGVSVVLRNLLIRNLSGGSYGVVMSNGSTLRVEQCEIFGFSGDGITVNTPAQVSITDTTVRDNEGTGILLDNGATATISRVHALGNWMGIWANPTVASTVTAFISDTVANNRGYGIAASGATGRLARVYVTRAVASGNSNYHGFYAFSANAASDSVLELSSSVASRNGWGLVNLNATIESAGNNRISGNINADVSGIITVTSSK